MQLLPSFSSGVMASLHVSCCYECFSGFIMALAAWWKSENVPIDSGTLGSYSIYLAVRWQDNLEMHIWSCDQKHVIPVFENLAVDKRVVEERQICTKRKVFQWWSHPLSLFNVLCEWICMRNICTRLYGNTSLQLLDYVTDKKEYFCLFGHSVIRK